MLRPLTLPMTHEQSHGVSLHWAIKDIAEHPLTLQEIIYFVLATSWHFYADAHMVGPSYGLSILGSRQPSPEQGFRWLQEQ